ncbi:DUF4352 domain-containing protein [Phenylobacterium sp.]|uniref:DUF4352 domain-containing protein n=1 Tax=Phenylobacterium sp. TaxID=1871053 RepID=UPI002730B6D9|nr:DUF4352 domain-containing protein [Phenylobacterium sp.]MDP1618122.1 DUF4352 domain-containing protein [Phenylobacterium sp.]MDP1986525.1 DUF4352 domain-containing protein [Phenylobacterium sp.]
MTALLGLIALVALAALIMGVIALVRPIPKLKLTTRPRAGGLIIAALVVLAGVGTMAPPQSEPASVEARMSETALQGTTPAALSIGQPVEIGDFRVTISSVSERDAVGASVVREQAADGGVLVVVDYTIENISERPKGAFQLPEPRLIGPNGVVYEKDIGKTAAYAAEGEFDSKAFSDLNPGIRVRNAVVFEVSKSRFDRSTWLLGLGAGNRLRVSLQTDEHPDVANRDWGDCSAYAEGAERVICENPDLQRRDEILGAKITRHEQLFPDDEMAEIARLSEELFACRDRACLVAAYSRIEAATAGWPTR